MWKGSYFLQNLRIQKELTENLVPRINPQVRKWLGSDRPLICDTYFYYNPCKDIPRSQNGHILFEFYGCHGYHGNQYHDNHDQIIFVSKLEVKATYLTWLPNDIYSVFLKKTHWANLCLIQVLINIKVHSRKRTVVLNTQWCGYARWSIHPVWTLHALFDIR